MQCANHASMYKKIIYDIIYDLDLHVLFILHL